MNLCCYSTSVAFNWIELEILEFLMGVTGRGEQQRRPISQELHSLKIISSSLIRVFLSTGAP